MPRPPSCDSPLPLELMSGSATPLPGTRPSDALFTRTAPVPPCVIRTQTTQGRDEGGSEQDQSDREQQAFMEGLRVMGGPQRVPSFSLTSRGLERPA